MLSAPEDAATLPVGEVMLTWSSAPNAATYELQVALVDDFASLVIDETGLADTTFALTDLDADATYYWRVRGINGTGAGSYPTAYRFTISESGVTVEDPEGVPDRYQIVFEAGRLASGVYLYRLEAGSFSATGRMLLAK